MNLKNYQYDGLTKLLNRQAFHDELEKIMRESEEMEEPVTLAFADIDRFLEVNESVGHKAGDLVLLTVVDDLKGLVEEDAIIARYGGDEFAILFPGKERESSFLNLEKVREAVENRRQFNGEHSSFELKITISAGIASFPVDAHSVSELLRMADQAMYRAKELGGNQVRLAYEECMVPKTSHYTQTQLERLSRLSEKEGIGEAVLLREALDNLLLKYRITDIDS